MAKMGRPREFENVAAFEARNPDGFFEWCAKEGHIPLWEWFAVYMDTCTTTLCEYMKKDGTQDGEGYDETQDFAKAIKRVGQRIMGYLVENGLIGKYRDAITIFYMKNYGYTDKQEVDNNLTVTVQIAGDKNGLSD